MRNSHLELSGRFPRPALALILALIMKAHSLIAILGAFLILASAAVVNAKRLTNHEECVKMRGAGTVFSV